MSATLVLTDSATMLRRRIKHLRRYPSLTIMLIGQPVVILLLFVYIFGDTMGTGLVGASGGRSEYLAYITPTILVMSVASVALGTAVSVATDMTEGIIARFRSMAIAQPSVLAGHFLGAIVQSLLAVAVALAVALLLGFRPDAQITQWLGLAGFVLLVAVAMTWLTVAMGLASGSVETASNTPMFLILLPFLGSGFVPTDSMPGAMRVFAEHQPFTPIIEALRSLLAGDPAGSDIVTGIAWCVAVGVVGFIWSIRRYARGPAH